MNPKELKALAKYEKQKLYLERTPENLAIIIAQTKYCSPRFVADIVIDWSKTNPDAFGYLTTLVREQEFNSEIYRVLVQVYQQNKELLQEYLFDVFKNSVVVGEEPSKHISYLLYFLYQSFWVEGDLKRTLPPHPEACFSLGTEKMGVLFSSERWRFLLCTHAEDLFLLVMPEERGRRYPTKSLGLNPSMAVQENLVDFGLQYLKDGDNVYAYEMKPSFLVDGLVGFHFEVQQQPITRIESFGGYYEELHLQTQGLSNAPTLFSNLQNVTNLKY